LQKIIEEGCLKCLRCPVECEIPDGYRGACKRYKNSSGELIREAPLVVPDRSGPQQQMVLEPLLTGIGSGTTAPCHVPAPYIIEEKFDGIDVVTVVSEVPLSYSGMKVKIDTNVFLGDEGAAVRSQGRVIGRVTTEEYGSKMLALGGVNILHGKSGSMAARTIVDLADRKSVDLKIEHGKPLQLKIGDVPLIDGKPAGKMRVGCGSATIAMFAPYFKQVADEVIVLDPGITGLFSEHQAGRAIGTNWSGITPVGNKSTIGRYFGDTGPGLGGTKAMNARDAVVSIDMTVARPGMTLLVTDTAGETGHYFKVTVDGDLEEISMPDKVRQVVDLIRENCEEARVSAVLMAGVGGSARAGVSKYPIKLTHAVHSGIVRLTVAGSPVFLLPGGGISFGIDVEKLPVGSVTWVPTPALVMPVEYTMSREVYAMVEGHLDKIRPKSEAIRDRVVIKLSDMNRITKVENAVLQGSEGRYIYESS